MNNVLYVPVSRSELSSLLVALDIALETMQTEAYREDVQCVRERLTNLALMIVRQERELREYVEQMEREDSKHNRRIPT